MQPDHDCVDITQITDKSPGRQWQTALQGRCCKDFSGFGNFGGLQYINDPEIERMGFNALGEPLDVPQRRSGARGVRCTATQIQSQPHQDHLYPFESIAVPSKSARSETSCVDRNSE